MDGRKMYLTSTTLEEPHTRAWLQGKPPELVKASIIRPTNLVLKSPHRTKFAPLVLAKGNDGYLYIIDGNHRFFHRLMSPGDKSQMPGWILAEGDQALLRGQPMPQFLSEWKEGLISLSQLTAMAEHAYLSIGGEADSMLGRIHPDLAQSPFRQSDCRSHSSYAKALALSQLTIRIIKGDSDFRKEASLMGLLPEEVSSLYKCFIDSGVRGIQERLESLEKRGKKVGK
jgi:hypothetical protein